MLHASGLRREKHLMEFISCMDSSAMTRWQPGVLLQSCQQASRLVTGIQGDPFIRDRWFFFCGPKETLFILRQTGRREENTHHDFINILSKARIQSSNLSKVKKCSGSGITASFPHKLWKLAQCKYMQPVWFTNTQIRIVQLSLYLLNI